MRSTTQEHRIDILCAMLARGDMSFETIARRLGMSRSGIARQVDRLRKRRDPRVPVIIKGRKDGASGQAAGRRRHAAPEGKRKPVVLAANHIAVTSAQPLFPGRVIAADDPRVRHVLISGENSRKIGGRIDKGPRRGWPIYTLTLPERATCPRSCAEWASCYGNGSNWAIRLEPGQALEDRLVRELVALQNRHPGGFLIRLHVLGDFYSTGYVALWAACLEVFPALHVFGFTARDPGTDPIGCAVDDLARAQWDRFSIRFSGRTRPERAARVVDPGHADPLAVMCPQQTGATAACSTCGLCFAPGFTRSIGFMRH